MRKKKTIKKGTVAVRKDEQLGVVLENINSKLDLVLESFGTLDNKIDRVQGELKEELHDFKGEMRFFQKQTAENFEKLFEFRDSTEANFKVTLEYLSRLDDEIQDIRKEMEGKPNLLAAFEKRLKNLEKDLAVCKKALALR